MSNVARRPRETGHRTGQEPPAALFFTTQPGWAFATLAELRALGVRERAELWHRDSTLVLPVTPATEHLAESSC
jgi:hypothetical protein